MIEYTIFSPWASIAVEAAKETKFGTKVAYGMRTCVAQRKHTIPHLTMKNEHNIIEYYNNTQQGAPHTGKQTCACTAELSDASHVTCEFGVVINFVCSADVPWEENTQRETEMQAGKWMSMR